MSGRMALRERSERRFLPGPGTQGLDRARALIQTAAATAAEYAMAGTRREIDTERLTTAHLGGEVDLDGGRIELR